VPDRREPNGREQRLLKHARREGLLLMGVWAVALVWSTVTAAVFGYHRPAADMTLILGMPDWVFWSIVFPWGLSLLFSVWFCFFYMADDDLGEDRDQGGGHA
jgi:hypothetical protein